MQARKETKIAFRDIKTDILRKITSGKWAPGTLLPNEEELALSYGCARATVNRAMQELAKEGILERKRKAGTRVCQSPIRQAKFNMPIIRNEIEERGFTYRYSLATREIQKAPSWLKAKLSLSNDGKVLRLVCIHYSDGMAYQYEDRWINLDALPQAKDIDFSTISPNDWLTRTVPYSDVEVGFSATNADSVLSEYFDCSENDALFQCERSTWWKNQPITYVRLVFQRGHRMTTRY